MTDATTTLTRERADLIESLRVTLASPCDEHPHMERFAAPPTSEGRRIEVSCSS